MKIKLLVTLCLSGTLAIGQTISQGLESTYDSPQGINKEIKSIHALPEGVQWGDTTVGYCAHRIPLNGTTLLPWWYESATYVNGQITEDYQSYYYGSNLSNVGYIKMFNTYIPDGVETETYESSDSLNWIFTGKAKSRSVIGATVDSSISYNWNAGMNKYILAGLTVTYKGSYGVDSVKQYDPLAQIFNFKTVNYRTNSALDSIITYNNNSGWEPWDRTIYYGNYSIRYPGGGFYAPTKTYWDALGNATAIVNYDFTTGVRTDSSFSFFTGSRVDSTLYFDGAGIFTGAGGARYSNTLHRFYSWDANFTVTNFQYRYFNLQGDVIGSVSFFSNGQIRSKWGICAVYNSLEDADNLAPAVRLSPNPTFGTIILEGNFDIPIDYFIFDCSGRELLFGSTYANELIDVSSLFSGTYILVYSSGETVFTERFIKL